MRRLTLILSDLYLPEDGGRDASTTPIYLPHFEWLLRFADARVSIGDWRGWLARRLGRAALLRLPYAQLAARVLLAPGQAQSRGAWLAVPVHLEARLDHVRLVDRGLLRTTAEERAHWCAAFARDFGDAQALFDAGARGFLLTGIETGAAVTTDPARLLDSDVGAALPPAHAGALRRLAAEIEMWLHDAPLNLARARAGQLTVSALWLWGGGAYESPGPEPSVQSASQATMVFYGEDPWLAALARETTGRLLEPAPPHFDALPEMEHSIVELANNGAAAESLPQLDVQWLAPARAALERRALDELEIVANDGCFRVSRHAGLRFWRRRRHWLENLRHPARQAKA